MIEVREVHPHTLGVSEVSGERGFVGIVRELYGYLEGLGDVM